ncbi:MAG: flavodoxin [Chlorobium sp.]|uniref:flavodoxin n=1 Tax=Chlorobium sp. TaxID=1095 RepID=UPI001D51F12A|nr:flavodoxin [Chlorobium sp.]MBN1279229.1 flavodoxin [Chlorobiaceae bacterium]MCF8217226.1 flavodoxin [Chlorobium sp.]MCF8272084.1 flavodoxin [Chlorobium sp.]MCF8288445.1 flavodoxin [Chlorobium sp.]MCF8292035.1 flavodoxin [Chlorobium sp.]
MKKIGLFWGSETGNTEQAAGLIAEAIGYDYVDSYNIRDVTADTLTGYDALIIGTSTWGAGELQDDWYNFYGNLELLDFGGKTVAFFGLGDQLSYGDYYLDAMGILYEKFIERGAKVTGSWPVEGYEYSYSKAVLQGSFIGLALDADNQDHLTQSRIQRWVAGIKPVLL